MADVWLGFLETMKPRMAQKYGHAAADSFITKVQNDYKNPNYRGYNIMYHNLHRSLLSVSHSVLGRKPKG